MSKIKIFENLPESKFYQIDTSDYSYKLKVCCDEFKKQIQEDNTFGIFSKNFNGIEPKIAICNDGGHGGIFPINFCPFCGEKIIINQR